jgi:hypothetical protein
MDKQSWLFINPEVKKHSVRYYPDLKEAAMSSIYVMKSAFPDGKIPKCIMVTLEEEDI